MQRVNPPELAAPPHNRFARAVIAPAGRRTAYLAGHVALDVNAQLVGGADHAAQARQAFSNIRSTIETLGASPQDIVQLSIYVVNYTPDLLPKIDAAGDEAFGGDWPIAAGATFGVAALGMPEFLIEVVAIVVIPD